MFKLSKRRVQISLGLLWLLDGALQLQHQMFSSAFATQVITPAAQGQPGFVSGPMHFGMHLFLLHPAVFNSLFALTQLGIGALILWKRTLRLGLLLSIPWALVVWVFGEGYGGIFSGHTLLLMGAPGAVSLYAILALACLPSRDAEHKPKHQPQVAFWLALVWLVLWVGGGIYQLLPGQNSTDALSAMISGNADSAPTWLASVDTKTASYIKHLGADHSQVEQPSQVASGMNMTGAQMTHMSNQPLVTTTSSGILVVLGLAWVFAAVGFGVLFSRPWRTLAISCGIIMSLAFWVVGQSLGGYYTGVATDPNSGPLFVLLGLAILGCANLDQRLLKLGHRIEYAMVGKPTGRDESLFSD